MSDLQQLFDNNARWAEAIKEEDPSFFEKLAKSEIVLSSVVLWDSSLSTMVLSTMCDGISKSSSTEEGA